MTATDELRRMLDERGAKYEVDDAETVRVTHWEAYGNWASFIEYDNGETKFYIDARRLTPAQAVDATLGRGTCHATSIPPVHKYCTGCSNCGAGWDFFYNICGYMGPPNFCPKCGAKVMDA